MFFHYISGRAGDETAFSSSQENAVVFRCQILKQLQYKYKYFISLQLMIIFFVDGEQTEAL